MMTHRALQLIWLCALLPFSIVAGNGLRLTFCYEDKQLLPYYTGEGDTPAYLPGVTIEHLKASVALLPTPVTLKFVRLPWLRCLHKLELNEVDALVATYQPQRSHFAVYPTTAEGEPDPTRAMSQHASCLVHHKNNDIEHKISQGTDTLVVSRPLGHSNPDYPASINVVTVHSQQQALELVVSGRVDATITLCRVNGVDGADPIIQRTPLVLVYPPLYQTTGYLVFSNAFYRQHDVAARQLWQLLGTTIKPQRYYDYLRFPDTAKLDVQSDIPEQ